MIPEREMEAALEEFGRAVTKFIENMKGHEERAQMLGEQIFGLREQLNRLVAEYDAEGIKARIERDNIQNLQMDFFAKLLGVPGVGLRRFHEDIEMETTQ